MDDSLKWSDTTCTEESEITDAYGEVEFLGHNSQPAKYIKVSHMTDVSQLIKMMFSKSHWNLKKPKMLISVSGGTKLSIKPDFKTKFCQGLSKVTKTTGKKCLQFQFSIIKTY